MKLNDTQIIVQAIPDRVKHVKKQLAGYDYDMVIDREKRGAFWGFKQCLEVPQIKPYRLHFQDDILLAKDFLRRFDEMNIGKKQVISLFASPRKVNDEAYRAGKHYEKISRFLWLQAVLFSAEAIHLLNYEKAFTTEKKHDDVFVDEVLKKHGIIAFTKIPGIVQHDLSMDSSIGHSNSLPNRKSRLFIDELNSRKHED